VAAALPIVSTTPATYPPCALPRAGLYPLRHGRNVRRRPLRGTAGQAIRESKADRAGLFITSKVSPEHLQYDDVLRACDASLRRLAMDYLDLYLIHWPSRSIPLDDSFRALNRLVADGRVKRLGVSNFDLSLLKNSQILAATPIATNQIRYSLYERTYIKNGLLAHCQANNILLTAYSPVKEGHLKTHPALQAVAAAHRASPYQVALAWLVAQPKVITIPMSSNPDHQAENFRAADLELSADELHRLDASYERLDRSAGRAHGDQSG